MDSVAAFRPPSLRLPHVIPSLMAQAEDHCIPTAPPTFALPRWVVLRSHRTLGTSAPRVLEPPSVTCATPATHALSTARVSQIPLTPPMCARMDIIALSTRAGHRIPRASTSTSNNIALSLRMTVRKLSVLALDLLCLDASMAPLVDSTEKRVTPDRQEPMVAHAWVTHVYRT